VTAGNISERTLLWALLAFAGLAFAVNLWAASTFIHDDALIGFRYIRNLRTHGDFSWNPGDRIEGYTNFLDLVLVGGLVKLGLPYLTAARLLHATAMLAMFAIAAKRAGDLAPPEHRNRARIFALATLLSCIAIPVWLWGGLETLLATAFATAGVAVLTHVFTDTRRTEWRACLTAGVFLALGVLTRPDGIVFLAASGLSVLLLAPRPLNRRILLGLALSIGPVILIGGQEIFRICYYGDWLPNTFWAKSGVPLDLSMGYAVTYLGASAIFVLALPVFLVFLGMSLTQGVAGEMARVLKFLGLTAGLWILYVVLIGGDHMPAARFFVPCMGVVALGLGLLSASATPARAMAMLAALVSISGLAIGYGAMTYPRVDAAEVVGTQVAKDINARWKKGSLVALHTAGSTPWLAPDFTYIDMLGLNDRAIAHRKVTGDMIRNAPFSMPGHLRGDGAYVLQRQPDYIILGPADGRPASEPWFISDVELVASEEFRRCYRMQQVRLPRSDPPRNVDAPVFTWFERSCPKG
jgi:MFS family permease